MDWRPNAENDRLALTILAGFLVARLAFAFALGLGVDESYTIAISRRLSLSYFDHPPLHQWIVHFAALAVGENVVARAPFVALFFATGWIYYRLTSGLFDPQTALIALFALNVTPFFFASAGSWIVPDGPLLFGLALAALAAARLFFAGPQDDASAWRLWLVVGVGLGLAGLSKYSAVAQRWRIGGVRSRLAPPAPLAQTSGSLCRGDCRDGDGNAGHRMERPARLGVIRVSGRRAAFRRAGCGRPSSRPWSSARSRFYRPGYSRRWLAAWRARSANGRDERRVFLLCLSLPPIALFTLTPLWGGRGQPHWTMPGWFFAFALMGVWLKPFAGALRRWAVVSSVLLAAIAGAAILQASTGWPWLALTAGTGLADPMLEAFEWRELRTAPVFDQAPGFVVATKWSDAGKIALALGPQIPVFVLSNDPRGWAFMDDSASFVGRSGVIVTRAD